MPAKEVVKMTDVQKEIANLLRTMPDTLYFPKSTKGQKVFSVYKETAVLSQNHLLVICHGENPHCYPFLDFVAVYSLKRRSWNIVCNYQLVANFNESLYRVKQFIGLGVYQPNIVSVMTCHNEKYYIDLDAFEALATGTPVREVSTPDDFSKLENLFNYKAVGENGFVLVTKVKVTVGDFLNFPPFNKRFEYFAFEGVGTGQASVSFESHRFNYGHSTTCCSDAVWKERDLLLECLHKVFPYHPVINELFKLPVYISKTVPVSRPSQSTVAVKQPSTSALQKDPFKALFFDTKRTLSSVVAELRNNGFTDAQIFNAILTDLGDADCYKGRIRHK